MTTALSTPAMAPRTDLFEHLFQRLEQESAQRALEEEERDRAEAEAEGRPTWQEVADEVIPPAAAATTSASTATVRAVRERRRTSLSVSRIGVDPLTPTPLDASNPTSQPSPPSTRASRSSSIALSRSPHAFYQLDHRPSTSTSTHTHNTSADSFASSLSTPHDFDVPDEPSSVTQQLWAPKQSLSKAISRRLSRATGVAIGRKGERDVLPIWSASAGIGGGVNASVVIGVAVEEAVVDAPGEGEAETRTKVYTGTLRTQHSSPGMRAEGNGGWVSKAKDMTAKLRRRSVAVLGSGSAPVATAAR